MKVLLVIDHFGSGGAQRQMVELACGLGRRGHAVEMFVYFPHLDFFRGRLDQQHITVHEHPKGATGPAGVLAKLATVMRRGRFDVVLSFLSTANIYAELARVAALGTRLVVSERTSYHDDKSAPGALLRRLLHLLADRVVANSETQAAWLRGRAWLRGKVACIYNGVDLQAFRPHETLPPSARSLRLLGVGRIGPEKNLLGLIAALTRFEEKFGYLPEVAWAGPRDESPAGRRYGEQLDAMLARHPAVQRHWRWLGLQRDVPALLRECHALVHPSFYEGAPNAICEALAAGRPVLASNVCDHPRLVAEGMRGFLFDPGSPESIVATIARLSALEADAWRAFGHNARRYAEAELGIDRMVGRYEELLLSLLGSAPDVGSAPQD
ncbi:MAG TPA: glycosyltransferase family 4 protein [Steroidobacteraceae bacterium]|jgi:glycosyltransferase involved in cell wall biosynthesis|nr:glycosyltransferase family 4 protein [Steroidobacteraceae bacterium]